MPIATNILVTTKNGNKTKTTNITCANPEAADSSLAAFAASLFSLSDNELVDIARVNKTSLDLPAPAGKASPNLSVEPTSAGMGTNATIDVTVSRLGDGAISVTGYNGSYNINGNTITFTNQGIGFEDTVTISVAETDDYAADSVEITVSGRPGAAPTPDLPD